MLLLAGSSIAAYETDQFTNRLNPIEDSTELLDWKVNETLEKIVSEWQGPRDDWKFVNAVYFEIGGRHWVDKIERWVMNSDEIERLQASRRNSIYQGHPFWATRVAALFGVGPTIKLNGQLVGSDKLGHFLSQGRKYYARYLRTYDEVKAAEQSAYTERALFGQMTTGVYSNADLVANYEGYRFYRSLFDDGIVPGKPSILSWAGDKWVIQSKFSWSDFVNEYWDEALNINHYDGLLHPHMKERLQTFCGDYYLSPERFEVRNEPELKARYAHLQLRDTSDLRMENLCQETGETSLSQTVGTAD
jgi:hypothetical protein